MLGGVATGVAAAAAVRSYPFRVFSFPCAAAVRSGGDSHYYDMRGAVVTEDLMRKADFARAMSAAKPGLIGEAVANFNEIQLRTAGPAALRMPVIYGHPKQVIMMHPDDLDLFRRLYGPSDVLIGGAEL
jgi:hypothetical protein